MRESAVETEGYVSGREAQGTPAPVTGDDRAAEREGRPRRRATRSISPSPRAWRTAVDPTFVLFGQERRNFHTKAALFAGLPHDADRAGAVAAEGEVRPHEKELVELPTSIRRNSCGELRESRGEGKDGNGVDAETLEETDALQAR